MSSETLQHDTKLAYRLTTAQALLAEAIPYFEKYLGRVESQWKADATRVTEADLYLSRLFAEGLRKAFPEDDFCSEESDPAEDGRSLEAEFAWVVDPIDGTNNFALGFPACAISLGLLRHGNPVYGWIYDGTRRVVLEGGPGLGLRCGGQEVDPLPQTIPGKETLYLAIHTPWGREEAGRLHRLLEVAKIRALGSSALHLALVAGGTYHGTVDCNVKVWDIAAGVALAQAVGAEIVFLNGPVFPLRRFSVSQPPLHYFACRPGLSAYLREAIESSHP